MNRFSPTMHLSAAVGERRGHGRARARRWASGAGAGRRALGAAAGELGGRPRALARRWASSGRSNTHKQQWAGVGGGVLEEDQRPPAHL